MLIYDLNKVYSILDPVEQGGMETKHKNVSGDWPGKIFKGVSLKNKML